MRETGTPSPSIPETELEDSHPPPAQRQPPPTSETSQSNNTEEPSSQTTDQVEKHLITAGNELQEVLKIIRRYEAQTTNDEAKERIVNIYGYVDRAFNAVADAGATYEKKHRARINLSDIQKDVKEMKAAVADLKENVKDVKETLAKKTYAQATQSGRDSSQGVATHRQSNRTAAHEHAKEELAATQLTITYAECPREIKETIETSTHKDINKQFQKLLDGAGLHPVPKLLGIHKLSRECVRLQFKTAEDAKRSKLAELDWGKAYPGAKQYRRKYGIVVHKVPTSAMEPNPNHRDVTKEWETSNPGLTITSITPLRKRPKRGPIAHQSVVVFTEDPSAADRCLKLGFYIESLCYRTDKFAPHLYIVQCFNCYNFGHTAQRCPHKKTCGKCGEQQHTTSECDKPEHQHKCANCKGNHAAWDINCPKREAEANRLAQLRLEASLYYTS